MPVGIYKRTRKNREAIRKSKLGDKNPFYGKKHSEKARKKISETRVKEKIAKGKNNPFYGMEHSEETKEKMREKAIGRKHTKEVKIRIGIASKKRNEGENSHFWKGGISNYPYPEDWTETLKESVRQRDNFICQECGTHQDELKGRVRKLDIHHIDYNKDNCNPDNLITLCRKCHIKTNGNRDYWINYFNKI